MFVLFSVKTLPQLPRVMGLHAPGGAFADLLMVQEFVHNFAEALDLGKRLVILERSHVANYIRRG